MKVILESCRVHTKCFTVSLMKVPDEVYSSTYLCILNVLFQRRVIVHTKCFTVSVPDEGYSRDVS